MNFLTYIILELGKSQNLTFDRLDELFSQEILNGILSL
jgi:hypothetical protein